MHLFLIYYLTLISEGWLESDHHTRHVRKILFWTYDYLLSNFIMARQNNHCMGKCESLSFLSYLFGFGKWHMISLLSFLDRRHATWLLTVITIWTKARDIVTMWEVLFLVRSVRSTFKPVIYFFYQIPSHELRLKRESIRCISVHHILVHHILMFVHFSCNGW